MPSDSPLGSSKTVPGVEWEHLEGRVLALDGRPTLLYEASLVMSGGTREPVEVCFALSPRRVALVLLELDGVAGVPKMYGVTARGTAALVLSRCYGFPLHALVAEGNVRASLLALICVCKIMYRIHSRGISYGNLRAHNIFVDVMESSDIKVSLVDFHLAKKGAEEVDIKEDESMMLILAKNVVFCLNEACDNSFHEEVNQIDVAEGLTLVEIAMLLCGFLNHHPTVILPQHKPVLPSSSP